MQIIFTKEGVITRQKISTPFGDSVHEEKYDYGKLPKNGIKLVVTGIYPKIEQGVLKEIILDVSHFEVSRIEQVQDKKIEITLSESAVKYSLMDVPKKFRGLFPGYKVPFILETNAGEIETYITGGRATDKVGDPNAGSYFSKGLSKWYKYNSDVKPGDVVVIEVIEPYKRYKLHKKT
jgi:hypothetical protein